MIISYARAYLVSFSNPLASGRLPDYQITKVRRRPCLRVPLPSGASHVSRHHCLTFECVRCAKKGMDFFPVSFLFGIVGINFLAVRIYTSALYIIQILYYLTQFLTLGNFSLFKSKRPFRTICLYVIGAPNGSVSPGREFWLKCVRFLKKKKVEPLCD